VERPSIEFKLSLKNISKFLYQAKTVDEKQVENWVTCACFQLKVSNNLFC
jgi:hypothetical protein